MRSVAVILCAACFAAAAPAKLVPHRPMKVSGYPGVPMQHFDAKALAGTVASVTSAKAGDAVRWELALDAGGASHPYAFLLPQGVAPALAKGQAITVDTALAGGGPNARAQLAISDADGPIVAIDLLPASWTADAGAQVGVDKGSTYDATTFAVLLHAPKANEAAELVADWRAFALAGHRYAASGTSVRRDLHGHAPPPDYVGGWIDYAIVRTDH